MAAKTRKAGAISRKPSSLKAAAAQAVTRATEKQRMLKQLICSDAAEQALRYRGYSQIAGVDEVGRGALFGPVVAAAVILPQRMAHLAKAGLKDSKQMTREDRERLDTRIRRMAIAVSVAEVDARTIDLVNIYQATRQAMLLAITTLAIEPDHLLIDAMRVDHSCAQTKLFYGDALSLSIAAASVVAKVHRDQRMRELDLLHPQYGLASHKGYATPEHRRALKLHGPCDLHRKSFAPVAAAYPEAIDLEPATLTARETELLEEDFSPLDILFEEADLESGTDLESLTEAREWA